MWDEFIIYFDAAGQLIKQKEIKMPAIVYIDESTEIDKYKASDVSPYGYEYAGIPVPTGLIGYYQYHIDRERWRYYNNENGGSVWLEESSDLPLYCFTNDSVSHGMSAGQRVVFKANWSYS